jgi:RNA polymerase sigma factor (sigma-70 family)
VAVSEAEVAALYRANVGRARALAVALSGDPMLAEDVVHEAFIRCAARRSALRDPAAFGTYLAQSVINTLNSHYRRLRAEQRSLARLAAQPARAVSGEPAIGEREELLAALASLPVRQRTAVAARYLLDWSEAQTAQALGCRVGTVKALTSRGLRRLRECRRLQESSDHD